MPGSFSWIRRCAGRLFVPPEQSGWLWPAADRLPLTADVLHTHARTHIHLARRRPPRSSREVTNSGSGKPALSHAHWRTVQAHARRVARHAVTSCTHRDDAVGRPVPHLTSASPRLQACRGGLLGDVPLRRLSREPSQCVSSARQRCACPRRCRAWAASSVRVCTPGTGAIAGTFSINIASLRAELGHAEATSVLSEQATRLPAL